VTLNATGTVVKGASSTSYPFYVGKPSPSLVNWFPALTPGTFTGQSQAAWSISASGQYVVLGGEFTKVNGQAQQGLVRMTTAASAPRQQGPQNVAATSTPTVTMNANGTATVSWATASDRDDRDLTYTLLRDGVTVTTRTVTSLFWKPVTTTVTDTGVTPHAEHVWTVQVRDRDGNTATSGGTTVTIN